LYWW